MDIQNIILKGKSIQTNNEDYYFWLDEVETYLSNLPNQEYINKAMPIIKNAQNLGIYEMRRNESISQLIAILKKIYSQPKEIFIDKSIGIPLLSIFTDSKLQFVQEGFETTIQLFNEGRYNEAIVGMCKTIETEMKLICKYKYIEYSEKDSFDKLVQKLKENSILPLNGMLTGYQTMRNKTSAHGIDDKTYVPTQIDAEFEINRGASLLIYLYKKSEL